MTARNGAAYPDKTRARENLSHKERFALIEQDQTMTEIKVDDVLAELKKINARLEKKSAKKKSCLENGKNGHVEKDVDQANGKR